MSKIYTQNPILIEDTDLSTGMMDKIVGEVEKETGKELRYLCVPTIWHNMMFVPDTTSHSTQVNYLVSYPKHYSYRDNNPPIHELLFYKYDSFKFKGVCVDNQTREENSHTIRIGFSIYSHKFPAIIRRENYYKLRGLELQDGRIRAVKDFLNFQGYHKWEGPPDVNI